MSHTLDADGKLSSGSYADAVKEDPQDVGNKLHDIKHDIQPQQQNSEEDLVDRTNEHIQKPPPGDVMAPSDGMSYADAIKEDPAEVGEAHRPTASSTHLSSSPSEKSEMPWSGYTSVTAVSPPPELKMMDYPDLPDDIEIERQHIRNRATAPEIAGIRWAPLRIPGQRRLQTLAVLTHALSIGISLSMFFFLCANPFLWVFIIAYLIVILVSTDATDGKMKKRKEWARRLPIWRYFAAYFPAKLHKTHNLEPTRKYIFGYHPHGIISHGAWVAFATDALGFSNKFPGITNALLTLDSNFRLPLYREYIFAMGVLSVSKESIINVLTRGGRNGEGMGRAVTIVVGGARESLEAQPNTLRLIINERKGFIKLALSTGSDLVPVLAFGENDLYDQLKPDEHPYLHSIQRYFLKVWKFTVPLLHGRGIFNYDVGLMPYRRPLNIVVGKPIKVVQNGNAPADEVDRLHDEYVKELRSIWDRYKDEFAKHRKGDLEFLN